ncbi:MAG TPA: SPOR domain-containing protein [Acidiferrobacterales bacterium]
MNLPSAPALLKWLFGALLLANIGLLMWGLWHRDAASDAAYQPLPPVNAEKMVPLTVGPDLARRADRAAQRGRPAPSLSPVKPERATPALRCLTVGPFDGEETAARAAERLGELHLTHTRREESRREAASYWVHLPPLKSRAAAEARLQELKKLGVKDAFIMQEPDKENAISLGLFSQAENARGLMKELEAKGVKAGQEIRYRDQTLVWLEVSTPVAEELVGKLKRQDWGAGEVAVTARDCAPEATAPPAAPAAKPADAAP